MVITWFAFFLLGIVSFVIKDAPWFMPNVHFISWTIVLITSCVFVVAMIRKYDGENVHWTTLAVVFAGYFARVFLLFWDMYYRHIFLLPSSGGDTEAFYRAASGMGGGSWLYSDMLTVLFQFFGQQRIIGQYVNILMGITSIFFAMRILRKFTNNRNTLLIALTLGMLLPYNMILNAILLREALITLWLTASLYFFVLWLKDNKLWGIFLATGCTLAASFHHPGSIFVALGYAVCFVLYDRADNKFKFRLKSVVPALVSLLVFLIIDSMFGADIFRRLQGWDIESLIGFVEIEAGGSAYTFIIETGSDFLNFLFNTPVRMIYFILSPFPWYWRGPFDIIAFVFSSIFYGYSYWAAVKAIRDKESKNRHVIIAFFIISLACIFIFGWGSRNTGTAMRHRDKFMLFHVLMLSLSIDKSEAFYKVPESISERLGLSWPTR